MPDSKLTISREEALRIQFRQRKTKAMRHLRNALYHIEAMLELEKGS